MCFSLVSSLCVIISVILSRSLSPCYSLSGILSRSFHICSSPASILSRFFSLVYSLLCNPHSVFSICYSPSVILSRFFSRYYPSRIPCMFAPPFSYIYGIPSSFLPSSVIPSYSFPLSFFHLLFFLSRIEARSRSSSKKRFPSRSPPTIKFFLFFLPILQSWNFFRCFIQPASQPPRWLQQWYPPVIRSRRTYDGPREMMRCSPIPHVQKRSFRAEGKVALENNLHGRVPGKC